MLDPVFLSNYVRTVLKHPDNYGRDSAGVFSCVDCESCLLFTDSGCSITLQRDLLGVVSTAGAFERDYIAPVLRESYPEIFI